MDGDTAFLSMLDSVFVSTDVGASPEGSTEGSEGSDGSSPEAEGFLDDFTSFMPDLLPELDLPAADGPLPPAAVAVAAATTVAVVKPSRKRSADDAPKPKTAGPAPAADEKRRKYEMRLAKNRESASRSRIRRRKEFDEMTKRVNEMSAANAALTASLAASEAARAQLQQQVDFYQKLLSGGGGPAAPVVTVNAAATPQSATSVIAEGGAVMLLAVAVSFFMCHDVGALAGLDSAGGEPTRAGGRVILSASSMSSDGEEFAFMPLFMTVWVGLWTALRLVRR